MHDMPGYTWIYTQSRHFSNTSKVTFESIVNTSDSLNIVSEIILCTVYSVKCTLYGVWCTLCSAQSIVHSI